MRKLSSLLPRRASLLCLRLVAVTFLLSVLASGCDSRSGIPQGDSNASANAPAETQEIEVETVAEDLVAPWALAFAPDGRLFLTERPGRIRLIDKGELARSPVASLDVASASESGLLGLALDPNFDENGYLYIYHTYRTESRELRNRVVRMVEEKNNASSPLTILDDIPAGVLHSGGRIAFGPDGYLYITTGDTTEGELAQDLESLAGKILRITGSGSIPEDNPFADSPVYSMGHRNPQGLAWHPTTGLLFSTEHGPQGNDEVNLIEKGANYGWPEVQGKAGRKEFRDPIAVFSPSVAPSGADFFSSAGSQWNGSLFFAALRGEGLIRMTMSATGSSEVQTIETLLENQFGRLRDVTQGPDGWLYVATNNRDGRGIPRPGDDRILRIRLKPAANQ